MQLRSFVLDSSLTEQGTATDEYRQVSRQVGRTFYAGAESDRAVNARAVEADSLGMVFRGYYDDAAPPAPLPKLSAPVATIAGFPGRINCGSSAVQSWMITAVGVMPTHRRRGLLRSMITEELEQAQNRGDALAGLTASEAGIYERFGFGISTRATTMRMNLKARPTLRPEVLTSTGADQGVVHEMEPGQLLEAAAHINAQRMRRYPGQPQRGEYTQKMNLGVVDLEDSEGQHNRGLRGFVWSTADGPEALCVISKAQWNTNGVENDPGTVVVRDLQYSSLRGYLGLWNVLLQLDLIGAIRFDDADPRVLQRALQNPRPLSVVGDRDLLWTRVLDVPAVLQSRDYQRDGSLTMDVDDTLGLVSGRYHLHVSQGKMKVEKTIGESIDTPAQIRLDVAQLATVVFNGARLAVDLGLVEIASTEDAQTLVEMFDTKIVPYCDFGF